MSGFEAPLLPEIKLLVPVSWVHVTDYASRELDVTSPRCTNVPVIHSFTISPGSWCLYQGRPAFCRNRLYTWWLCTVLAIRPCRCSGTEHCLSREAWRSEKKGANCHEWLWRDTKAKELRLHQS
ncbi:hypothetical protein OPV22_028834 [Ensete ventricosum]|uniref:Uncharacterized protein n=1 Tax=Ensete ventricosum TaxID=4639 RepID=A0AAV8PZG8_ENSVE|nr:hypothetical protein OPV22_028834 [Ensete ventricosum]